MSLHPTAATDDIVVIQGRTHQAPSLRHLIQRYFAFPDRHEWQHTHIIPQTGMIDCVFLLSQLHSDGARWEWRRRRSCNNNRGTFRRFTRRAALLLLALQSATLTFHGPRFYDIIDAFLAALGQ
jgi:hypothetical protein